MMLLLHSMQSNVADGCFVYLLKLHTPVHHGGAVSQIISVISRYIHTSSNYMWSIQETACFCNPSQDFSAGMLARGNTYEIFLAYTRLSLSLSLSLLHWKRERKRRGQGELDLGRVQPPKGYHTWLTHTLPPQPTLPVRCVPYCHRLVAIRHTSDRYGAMPPFVMCAATRPVSIRYMLNWYGATPSFVVRFCCARHVQPPRLPFSVAPIQRRLPINLHQSPFTSHTSSGHIHPMAPCSPAPHTCATDSCSLLRHPPPVAIDISSKFNTLYIYSLSTTYSIVPCSLRHFTGMYACSSNPNIQVSNIVD
jgi:hypothetical protein